MAEMKQSDHSMKALQLCFPVTLTISFQTFFFKTKFVRSNLLSVVAVMLFSSLLSSLFTISSMYMGMQINCCCCEKLA